MKVSINFKLYYQINCWKIIYYNHLLLHALHVIIWQWQFILLLLLRIIIIIFVCTLIIIICVWLFFIVIMVCYFKQYVFVLLLSICCNNRFDFKTTSFGWKKHVLVWTNEFEKYHFLKLNKWHQFFLMIFADSIHFVF